MFAKATKNFVREIDCGGDLIPVSRLNNLDKLQFLNLVTKKKKTWCWQKPKYHLLSVTLNDVLAKDEPIKPVVVESDFVKYEGKFEDYVKGNIETSFGTINLGAGGRGVVESQLSFGNLKKQEADLQKLMKDVEGKAINLHNTLLQQMLERKHEVLCILTERIVTTQKCLISEHIQTEEKMASMVGIKTKVIKVSVSENGNVIKDSNVILEIPAPTAIAYAVIELYIKRDGQFEFCLLHDQEGGFERESMEGQAYHSAAFRDAFFPHLLDAVDSENPPGPVPSDAPLNVLNKDALQLKTHFQPFMKLSEEKQGTLYQLLCDFLLQEEMVTELEDVLDQICTEDKPELLVMVESKPPVQKNIEDFLQLVGIRLRSKQFLQKDPLSNKELLLAAHILLSAIAELSDYALVLLRACCELQVVPALCCLPNVTSADGTLTLADPALAPLADTQRFQIAQRLFALSNINLEMTESCIKAVTMKKPRFSPIILYIALYGLRALGCKTAQA
nr:gasdermin-E isoform X1 [Zootoca vivipara]XP_034985099.1 gasdermin-E isoform X1 [Zootoca vivipara]XP_034985100.1 gasdermin-E isoform X1 [Zootoca vivipara]XP_034985101.1 gasdermin-E isoform X1 [Zootoca vivipara]XP_034985102.1 gasdermin-E isoform X1 [Zootoca vivipara]XP_034985103.1 gasdermin-E isoform X1 [Zootoca vivipara]XP_034985105.1 gasdermin-E isoform X1 [Zootoca vivipara]